LTHEIRIHRARRATATAAALLATLVTAQLASASRDGGPIFDGPTIKNPSRAPEFALHDQTGRIVRLLEDRGKVVLLTFLYTHCPDVCPLTASNLNTTLRMLGTQRSHVRVLAISVDPHGDTPQAVRRFIAAHHLLPEFQYLTGSAPTLRKIWAAYGVKSLRQAGESRVDHTLYTLLLDKNLKTRVLYDSTATPTAISHDVRLLLR
jgi:protein SCO1/2